MVAPNGGTVLGGRKTGPELRNVCTLLIAFIPAGCDPIHFNILHNSSSAERSKLLPHIADTHPVKAVQYTTVLFSVQSR